MKRVVAERYRDIDFSRAKRGPVITPEPGKTKISIRLDNAVLEVIRSAAPYAPLPNDMLGDRHTFLLPLNYRRNDQ